MLLFVDGRGFLGFETASGKGVFSLLAWPGWDSGALRRLVVGGGI